MERPRAEVVLSTPSKVTLELEAKRDMGIPSNAEWFSWSYGDATHQSDALDDPALGHLCRAGGYMYFDDKYKVVHVLAVTSKKDGGVGKVGTLGFLKPTCIGSSLAKCLGDARRDDLGQTVSGIIEGEYKGLRMKWLSPTDVEGDALFHGGFLFYYPDHV